MADRFYTEQPLNLGEVVLDGPEAHHLAAVRRFEPGDTVTLFNGDGCEYPAEVLSAGKKQVVLIVKECAATDREAPFPIVIASALPKGDRADYMIEKLVELGVTTFVPLITARSVVQPKEAKTEKFQRAVIEASKQCGRNRLMKVEPPCKFEEYAKRELDGSKRILVTLPARSASKGSEKEDPLLALRASQNWLVGPEGGFTPEEVELAIRHGWQPTNLGPRILRIETAAVAAAVLSSSSSSAPATPS